MRKLNRKFINLYEPTKLLNTQLIWFIIQQTNHKAAVCDRIYVNDLLP